MKKSEDEQRPIGTHSYTFYNAYSNFRICIFTHLYIKKGARIEIRPRF